ncbi:hypothetical protein SEEM841_10084 [Salmonella enterica subsp. enterica serovar Senftenberg str. 423984-1]|nr:hypothetical protein SEES004_07485 [Salmonella enterica subsp. enterica serovar Senftenberg str. 361154004]ESC17530.1 hypothetical protein SEEM841_10084 [Salmonella enterica subsp. enterica serovar Senftenberg str. 423984-1]
MQGQGNQQDQQRAGIHGLAASSFCGGEEKQSSASPHGFFC